MLALLLLAPLAGAVDWPADPAWVSLRRDGALLLDGGDADGGLDLGGGAKAVAGWFGSPTTFWFRLRLLRPPATGPALTDDGWGLLFDLDGDDDAEALLTVTGVAGTVSLWRDDGRGGALRWPEGAEVASRVVALTGITGVDLAVPAAVFVELTGARLQDPIRVSVVSFAGTDPDARDGWADVAGCAEGCDAPFWSDDLAIDPDDDLWPSPWEADQGTDPLDDDVDDDGLLDGDDPSPKTCDADRDGLNDGLERGLVAPVGQDTAEGVCFVPDADPTSVTDPTLPDSDGGGLSDGAEDRDGDGAVHPVWEADPADPSDDADVDADGFADAFEPEGCVGEDDCDDDGLKDGVDGFFDPDGDGDVSAVDADADDDGLRDGAEGTADPDRDGLGAWLDLDSDGDGIPDGVEGTRDSDRDGTPDLLDLDADGDDVPDAEEGADDADCDGRPDFRDTEVGDGFCDTDLPRPDVDDGDFGDPDAPLVPASADDVPGCGCATPGGAPAGLAPLALLLGLRRRRR